MRVVRREDAVGCHVAHDLTQVVPGESKRVVLHRGEIVTVAHMPQLAQMGKEHVWVMEDGPVPVAREEGAEGGIPADSDGDDTVHENDAAAVVAGRIGGTGIVPDPPQEGKSTLRADVDGLLEVDREALDAFNLEFTGRAGAILRGYRIPVRKGEPVGVARIYPRTLTRVESERLGHAPPLLKIVPFRETEACVVVTGAEVASGRIPDAFGPLLTRKLADYGSRVGRVRVVTDDPGRIADAIREGVAEGARLVFVTGGMAVDPDDVTLDGILRAGTELEFFGVPMQPATLLLLGQIDGVPLFGVPAGVLYDPYTALDRLLPWVLAGVWPHREEVMRMGVQGMLGSGAGHRHQSSHATVAPGTDGHV